MKTVNILILLLLSSLLLSSQNYDSWVFGSNSQLRFPMETQPLGSAMQVTEGCASISDDLGNLLFYTNGVTVWNRNHAVMFNGFGLLGGNTGSSTSAAIILKQPNTTNIYFIFVVGEMGGNPRFSYSVVDINLQAGFGEVVTKNVIVDTNVSEKLTASRHCNGVDWWILTHTETGNTYKTYLLTPGGFNFIPVISNVGFNIIAGSTHTIGYSKFNNSGTRLTTCFYPARVELYNFNSNTGVISNPIVISSNTGGYSAEFSPNDQFIYITYNSGNRLDQYNVCTNTTINLGTTGLFTGAAQRHRNGKIYITRNGGSIDVIHDPNQLGLACNRQANYLNPVAGTSYRFGLPQQFYNLNITPIINVIRNINCLTVNFSFINNDCVYTNITSVLWNFGDGNTSTSLNPTHTYATANNYFGTLTVTYTCITRVIPFTLSTSVTSITNINNN